MDPVSMIDYEKIKSLLFKLDPETAHHLAMTGLRIVDAFPGILSPWQEKLVVEDDRLSQRIFGVTFPNPVGLAAGFDKDGVAIRAMRALGFGYTEVGTVTPRPQPGNPRPRLWRHVHEEALQNAMGFNNEGAAHLKRRLERLYPYEIPIGVNIGKNKTTPETDALEDYRFGIETFKNLCDYLVVNISSPNTPGLRDLQNEVFIDALFQMATQLTDKPVFLKIAPDMSPSQAVDLCTKAIEAGARGIIATNTSVDYKLVRYPLDRGGISGRPIREKSFAIFEAVAKELYGHTTLISVGGIDSGAEAFRRLKAGASLVQVLTGFIYRGPMLAATINRTLLHLMEREGFTDISEVIGADRR